jgi:hypothetical protein
MCQKTTQINSGARKIFNKWKVSWNLISRSRHTRSFRWIRSFMFSFDLSKSEGFGVRLDLFKKYHIEISIRSNKKI